MLERISCAILSAVLATTILMPATAAALSREQERNKATARRFFEEVLSTGDWEEYRRVHTPDFVAHSGKSTVGLEEDLGFAKGWRQAFPDLNATVNQIITEGDRIAVYWTGRGTNTGEGNGLPATGKVIEVTGVTIFRFAGGRMAEEWSVGDEYGMMRQLGLLPAR